MTDFGWSLPPGCGMLMTKARRLWICGKKYTRRDYAYDSRIDAERDADAFRNIGQFVEVSFDNDQYGGSWYCYIRIPQSIRIEHESEA